MFGKHGPADPNESNADFSRSVNKSLKTTLKQTNVWSGGEQVRAGAGAHAIPPAAILGLGTGPSPGNGAWGMNH